MATGMEISESGKSAGVAFELPASYSSPAAAAKIPRRIRQRLLEVKNPLSLEEIENKLKEAELRRQRFHEWLANKARRPKPRSPSWSSQDSDLGQRLQERHYAAEQKRLSMLMKAQMKLARLDELRKAARTEVEIRYEKEREALGSKVESRVQQAELNRMLILKARCHRRALARERISKSLLKRMNQEKKYKECISNSISRKRAAAEKKRLGFLEAEKMRAHLRVMQARRVAKTIYHRREVDRKRMKDKMEDRLQRAKRQRAEYLRQRGTYRFSNINGNNMHMKGEFLSRKLARCWKEFLGSRRTTFALAKAYEALQITEGYVKLMPFEQLAVHIESVATIQTVKALLERLESRFKLLQTSSSSLVNIDHLLKRLATPRKPIAKANRGREAKRALNKDIRSLDSNRLRYPTRVVLCAYMVLSHPDAVFSGNGEREVALVESALYFTRQFELLIKIILEGPSGNTTGPSQQLSPDVTTTNWSPNESSLSRLPTRQTFRSQLEAFDAAWCSYLYCFVVWKIKDARSLEDDLVRAACQLELSMMEKCKITAEGESNDLTHDMKAIQTQVSEDQKLLREKVLHLSGNPGIERMESALLEARLKFFEEKEKGTSSVTPLAHILSSSPIYSVESFPKEKRRVGNDGRSSRVARSLFKEESSKLEVDLNAPGGSVHGQLGSSSETLIIENIFLVNEIIHEGPQAFADNFGENNKHENEIKGIIKETMEKAFWDGIMNSLKEGEQPDYDRIVQLVKEVRDELCEMAPLSWKQEIIETIDLDILAQLLKSGTHDTGYLGRILEYALVTLRKLSAPAKTSEMETAHKNLLNELSDIFQSDDKLKSSFFIAAIKGLRFVLEEIQLLKWEISKARIRIMESFLKGRAGFEYLRKAFADRYGCPMDAILSLPLTSQWLGSVKNSTEQEWYEHVDFLSALKVQGSSTNYAKFLPSTSLRTGASIQLASNPTMSVSHPINTITDDEHLECKGESGDVLLRLGLLKLACGIDGVTQETLPETLKLNFSRLRAVQSQFQKIIVVSTSMLVLRQILLCENSNTRPLDMENIVSASVERLFDLFEHSSDVGIVEIIETINSVPSSEGVSKSISNLEKLQARKDTMARMLVKSLRADDAIFLKVARAVYLAARGVVLGGTTASGRELAAKALRPVGAIVLADRVVKTAETLVRMAMVSGLVHKQWYAVLAENV